MAKLFVIGIGVGSGVTYLFDPRLGPRRRALARDKAVHAATRIREQVDAGARDLSHRAQGVISMATGFVHALSAGGAVSDEVLAARVRSAMGRACSHPHAVHVTASGGCIELTGLVLTEERARLVRQVARVQGVRVVKDLLEPHTHDDGIPMLQGPSRQAKPSLVRRLSSPAGRLLMGSAALLALGTVAPSLLLPVGTVLGLGMAARSEDPSRARRARSLERRGSRRTRIITESARSESPTSKPPAPVRSANGHRPDGPSPTGQTRPVPPRPQ